MSQTLTHTEGVEAHVVNGNLVGADLFSHAYADQTQFNSQNTGGYASYDSIPAMIGATAYNHFYSFQSRLTYAGTGSLDTLSSFVSYLTVNGQVTTVKALRVYNPLGTGSMGNLVGLWIDNLTRGAANFAIFSAGATPSYHGGDWQIGGVLKVGSKQVVGARQPDIAPATDSTDAVTKLNAVIAALKAHGLIGS